MAQQHSVLDTMKVRRLGPLGLALILAAAASGGLLHAQATWSAGAQTGVPTFDFTGASTSQTVSSPHGPGVAHRTGINGVATRYIPVTAPLGSVFTKISLVALDNTPMGSVQASLYRRSKDQAPELLGLVITSDSEAESSDGFQRRTVELMKDAEFSGDCSYEIRLQLARAGDASVVALEVGLE